MIERTPEFLAAQDRVKVGHFTRQGFDIGNVLHVGANDGEEISYYLALGAQKVIAFEPGLKAFRRLLKSYGKDDRVYCLFMALGEHREFRPLHITAGDGKGSSFLTEHESPYEIVDSVEIGVIRADSISSIYSGFDTLVVDVQGMELDVLKGFGETLRGFKFLNIECSEKPIFDGESPAEEVIAWLDGQGFQQDSPIFSHDDIMFIRKGLK
jgi:FkbM family methyltransferase